MKGTLTWLTNGTIASDTGVGGSLAVAKGAQLFVLGEAGNPVIFASKADVAGALAAVKSGLAERSGVLSYRTTYLGEEVIVAWEVQCEGRYVAGNAMGPVEMPGEQVVVDDIQQERIA